MLRIASIAVVGCAASAHAVAPLTTVIDFDTDGAGNPLASGLGFSGNEYAPIGVTISSDNPPMNLFDTGNPTGNDADLETGPSFDSPAQGLVLIAQEDGVALSDPNDHADGASFTFDFDFDAMLFTVGLLDLEESGVPTFTADIIGGASGVEISPTDVDLVNPAFPGNNSLRIYSFDSSVKISSLTIDLGTASGAVTQVEFTPTPGSLSVLGLSLAIAGRRRR